MDYNLLSPVSDILVDDIKLSHFQTLGRKLKIHTHSIKPDLEGINIAIIGVMESRNSINFLEQTLNLNEIRKSFYGLFPGNWNSKIADLGDVVNGDEVQDTYFSVTSIVSSLLKKNIIPVLIGGSQDITYANYRAYDKVKPMINIVNVDNSFDLGDSSKPITNLSYVGKIILEKPYNLFNYTALGFQTYFNSQEEIDLMEKLYFEYERLGDISYNIKSVEPAMRDADLVTIDLNSVKSSEVSSNQKFSPNGFDGREICAISRYAGISNMVSSFGIYEYKPSINDESTAMLIAQMVWYFIEGVYYRFNEYPINIDNEFLKYSVTLSNQTIIFYKSKKSDRWWMELTNDSYLDNKTKTTTLLACTKEDYDSAILDIIPQRWYNAIKRLN